MYRDRRIYEIVQKMNLQNPSSALSPPFLCVSVLTTVNIIMHNHDKHMKIIPKYGENYDSLNIA